jgi:hypothetical protein
VIQVLIEELPLFLGVDFPLRRVHLHEIEGGRRERREGAREGGSERERVGGSNV